MTVKWEAGEAAGRSARRQGAAGGPAPAGLGQPWCLLQAALVRKYFLTLPCKICRSVLGIGTVWSVVVRAHVFLKGNSFAQGRLKCLPVLCMKS